MLLFFIDSGRILFWIDVITIDAPATTSAVIRRRARVRQNEYAKEEGTRVMSQYVVPDSYQIIDAWLLRNGFNLASLGILSPVLYTLVTTPLITAELRCTRHFRGKELHDNPNHWEGLVIGQDIRG